MKETTINIRNKWYELQEEESKLRCENANKIFGNVHHSILMEGNMMLEAERQEANFIKKLRLDEYQELLNPEGQDRMITLEDFCNNNSTIMKDMIYLKLRDLKYAYKYHFTLNGENVYWFAQKKPYTYLSIIPIYCPDTNSIILEHNLVLSDEAAVKLKSKCEIYEGTRIEGTVIFKFD